MQKKEINYNDGVSFHCGGVLFVSLIMSIMLRERVSRKNIVATLVAFAATVMLAL